MSPALRSSLLRALLRVTLGFLVLLALVSSVLWMIFYRPTWLDQIPDTEGRWLHGFAERCYHARFRWRAADTNDNGVPDWYETSQGIDLRSNPGASVSLCNVSGRPWYVFLGERTRIHLVLGVNRYEDIRWPANMEMQITAPGPILLAPGSPEGTPPTAGPLRVAVTPDGRLEFDVLREHQEDADHVKLTHARSGCAFNQVNGCVPSSSQSGACRRCPVTSNTGSSMSATTTGMVRGVSLDKNPLARLHPIFPLRPLAERGPFAPVSLWCTDKKDVGNA